MNDWDCKVFVIDDDKAVRDAIQMLLETAGYNVAVFASAVDFLAACTPECCGCIILDVDMPIMDGPALQHELRCRGILLPVIFLTGYGSIPITVKAIKAGAMDFLTKPVDNVMLLECIQAALEQSAHLHKQAETIRMLSERMASLTGREMEVMKLAVAGHSNKEIARCMGISHRTVEVHRTRVMQKTGASSLLELVRIVKAGQSSQGRED